MSAKYEHVKYDQGEYILRDSVIVADIVDGKVVMKPESEAYKLPARKFWKDLKAAPATSEPSVKPLHIPSPLDTVTEAGFVKHGHTTPAHSVTVSQGETSVRTTIPAKVLTFETDADIPPAPEMDPAAGTKTPAYAEWMRTYHPEKWKTMHQSWANKPSISNP